MAVSFMCVYNLPIQILRLLTVTVKLRELYHFRAKLYQVSNWVVIDVKLLKCFVHVKWVRRRGCTLSHST